MELTTPPRKTINATENDTREKDVNGARNEEPQTLGLLKARFNSKFVKMTLIVCYAPKEDAEEEIKDEFYDQSEVSTRTTPQDDMKSL